MGHQLGTMELEAALLRLAAVFEAAAVTQPDAIKSMLPVTFAVPRSGYLERADLRAELCETVGAALGAIARPRASSSLRPRRARAAAKSCTAYCETLPVTGEARGHLTSLENPEAIDVIRQNLASP